jgi:hypothetical protein
MSADQRDILQRAAGDSSVDARKFERAAMQMQWMRAELVLWNANR